ncbi:MAG: DNA translocase FtsK [Spirochaetes bacterium]|nr:DNA translocase FtsK [Spirochaetota bacterium]
MIHLFYRRGALIVCFLLSFLTGGTLILYLLLSSPDESGILSYGIGIGRILFESFHYASFFIPLYFACCGFLLLHHPFRFDWLVLLNLLLVPFFTLSLSLRLLFSDTVSFSPLPALFQRSFTSLGGGLVALFLFVVELAFLPEVYHWISNKVTRPPREPEEPLRLAPPERPDTEPSVPVEPQAEMPTLTRQLTEGEYQAESQLQSMPALEETETSPSETVMEKSLPPVQEEGENGENEEDEPLPHVSPSSYSIPVEGVLTRQERGGYWEIDEETQRASEVLRATLEEFKIQAEVVGIRKGPVITMFEILPAPGVKLSRIVNLADNIALRLAASSVRIVAPIPGKHAVGIEVPNRNRAIVTFGEMITEERFLSAKMEIPIALGKDIAGEAQIIDLVNTPHLLIAGATGSGKSVCVNSIICSILYKRSPSEVRLLLIDPKIVELKLYNDIPHLLTPVITEPKRAFQALQYAIYEMERRYSLLDGMGVRDIRSYNRKIKSKHIATLPLPYLVIIIDEFADLMATTGKELESTLARLAAMSRAVGIHLVLATQRPSIDVITGLIKANIPSRIAFMVASKFDSRIIIDAVGAEKLLGRGDMLFTSAWDPFPLRMQGAYVSEEEIERIVEEVRKYGEPDYIDEEIFIDEEEGEDYLADGEEDPLLDKAIEIVTTAGKASASYLQRRLKVGYNRAARMIEIMERRGIVGPADGSKPRKVL